MSKKGLGSGLVSYETDDSQNSARESCVELELDLSDSDDEKMVNNSEEAFVEEIIVVEGESVLPPEPTGECDQRLSDKVYRVYKQYEGTGLSLNTEMQNTRTFRNPSIYTKLVEYIEIDQEGSNFDKKLYDPHGFEKTSYIDNLLKQQHEYDINRLKKDPKKSSSDTNTKWTTIRK